MRSEKPSSWVHFHMKAGENRGAFKSKSKQRGDPSGPTLSPQENPIPLNRGIDLKS